MPSFITRGIDRIKGVFTAIAGFFARLFNFFKRKPRKYTYTVSSDDVTTSVEDESNPKNYISDMVQALKIVDPNNNLFKADLNRFSSVVFNSTEIYPAYDLTTLEGRTTLINDKLIEHGLTMDRMKASLAFLTQSLPLAVLIVLHRVFNGRNFLSENGDSELKVDGDRISLTWDLNIYVTANNAEITDEDMERKKTGSGKHQLNLLTVATIDLSKFTVDNNNNIQLASNAITQEATIKIINNKFNLDLTKIDKKLHEKIPVNSNEEVAATPPLAETLAKKNLLTHNFSNLQEPSTTESPSNVQTTPSPKLKSD